jgi:glutamate racemase
VTAPRILIFDSGMGGLTVASCVRAQSPEADLVYAADNAGFPYGAWKEDALVARIVLVVGALIAHTKPDIVVIACNTASTLAMGALREKFAVPFVGTVPAIKPAAALTKTNVIGVLATPGTVSREYTRALIHSYAFHCEVILHGAGHLAEIAERKLKGEAPDLEKVRQEISPVFRTKDGKKTDVVVLGCTHYPLLVEEMKLVAPWGVDYLDPAPAIARRVADVMSNTRPLGAGGAAPMTNTVLLTSPDGNTLRSLTAYTRMGFSTHEIIDLPV